MIVWTLAFPNIPLSNKPTPRKRIEINPFDQGRSADLLREPDRTA